MDDWDRLMQGELADVSFIDPPYNCDVGRKNKILDDADGGKRKAVGSIKNDKLSDEDFRQFLVDSFAALFVQLKTGSPIYVAHSDRETVNFCQAFKDAGFHQQSVLIWKKDKMVLGKCDWQSISEPILYGYKKGSAHRWYGGRKNTNVIDLGAGSPFVQMEDGRYQIKIGDSVLIVSADAMVEEHPSSVIYEPKPAKSGLHPTQKPVKLVERLLSNSARAGDIVVDAFGGSGTTMLAADRLGMSSRLMELDPRFVDVIVRRWQDYTGRKAVHAETGELFDKDAQPETAPVDVLSVLGLNDQLPDIF
jgi:DNA modification methylase